MRLAAAVKEELDRRNLTVNAAHLRFNISREAMTRLAQGIQPQLETVERFARALGQDVNRWRELAGYEPITDRRPLADRLQGLVYELELEIEAQARGGQRAAADCEALRRAIEAIRREDRGLAE